jgi:quercetin dioxygenase-like cupin family protein
MNHQDDEDRQRAPLAAAVRDGATMSSEDYPHLRSLDIAAIAQKRDKERYEQDLIDALSGGTNTMVRYVATPSGSGSPAGLHVHEFEQLFYILSGVMNIEIDGDEFEAKAGDLVVFRQGVPHRNWNGGVEETVHLAINSPLPDPNKPLSIPVPPRS